LHYAGSDELENFESLVTKFERLVYTVCYRMTGNEQDARDMTQETFLKLYTAVNSNKAFWENDKALASWLCKVASNRCVDELRKRRGVVLSLDDSESGSGYYDKETISPDDSPERSAISKEALENIQTAINALPPEQKQAVILRDVRGYSYEEVAEMTNSSVNTVKSRIFRGREKLKILLREYGEHYNT